MKVKPNLPTFTKYDLDTILLEAVDSLLELEKRQKKGEEEEEEEEKEQEEKGEEEREKSATKRSFSEDLDDIFDGSTTYKLPVR